MIKRFITTASFTGIPFGVFMGLFFTWQYGNDFGIPSGIVSGIFFGLAIAAFVERQRKKMESNDGTFEGEKIIHQGPANHFLNGEGRGGWLTLTSSLLAFRSHGSNVQNQPYDLNVNEIIGADPAFTFYIIPNGLRISTNKGDEPLFVVSKRKQWASLIKQQIKAH